MLARYSGFRAALALLAALVLAAGCGQPAEEVIKKPAELTPEQQSALLQRVEDRWHARIAGDWGKAWEYTSPSYREVFPKHLYVKKFSYAAEWELTGAELLHYDGVAAVASVVVRVMSKPTKQTSTASVLIGAIPRELREKWIFEQGEWWYSVTY